MDKPPSGGFFMAATQIVRSVETAAPFFAQRRRRSTLNAISRETTVTM